MWMTWLVYKRCRVVGPTVKHCVFKYDAITMHLPQDALRATVAPVRNNRNRVKITGWHTDVNVNPLPPTNQYSWMVTKQDFVQHIPWLVEQLWNDEPLIGVSDGSYHPDFGIGTSSWAITGQTRHHKKVTGGNIVPGHSSVQCPHRSELCGLVGLIRHVDIICADYNITSGQIEVGCDGEEAFKIATRAHFRPATKISHFDIVSRLHHLINNNVITWTFRHVRGDQDKNIPFFMLDIWSRLNVLADADAKILLWEYIISHQPPPLLPMVHKCLHPVSIEFQGSFMTIHSRLKRNLCNHIAKMQGLRYWNTKHKKIQHYDTDLEAFTHAARNVPLWQHRWLSKWQCVMCGVGRWLERWKDQPHSKCPRCLTVDETVDHVIHCPHASAALCLHTSVEEMRAWMVKHHSYPGLAEAVMD